MKVHDVTLVLRPGMVTWKNEPGPAFAPLRRISKGDTANVSTLSFADHTGTHVDPPLHFIEGGATVDQLPVDALVGRCRVIGYDGTTHITAEWLERSGAAGAERVLFRTRNSELWRTNAPFTLDFVTLDPGAAGWLADRGVKLVGIDYLSIEPQTPGRVGYPTHLALLSKGIVIVEGLDLSDVEPGDYDLVCGSLKLEGMDGAPARVFLIER